MITLQQQTADKPLFPDLLWSRPENKLHAGKLLIVGGSAQEFAAPAAAYAVAQKAGIGAARVVLPDALHKSLGNHAPDTDYAPSTPSGSFAKSALSELLGAAQWADGTLLAGNLGRNSETAILLEQFLAKHVGAVTITGDAIEYVTTQPVSLQRQNTLLVLSFSQLQKLGTALKLQSAFTFDTPLLKLVDQLHELTSNYSFGVVTRHFNQTFVAVAGQVSSTPVPAEASNIWRLDTSSTAAVWWLQNPEQAFAAITTSLIV